MDYSAGFSEHPAAGRYKAIADTESGNIRRVGEHRVCDGYEALKAVTLH